MATVCLLLLLLLAVAGRPASTTWTTYCNFSLLHVRRIATSAAAAATGADASVSLGTTAAAATRAAPQNAVLRGMFGQHSPRTAASGALVHVIDRQGRHTGCSDDVVNAPPPPPHRRGGGGWIALVQRGGCKIFNKTSRMFSVYGAAGIIVYNLANQTLEAFNHADFPGLTVSIGDADGRQLVTWLNDTTVETTVGIRPADPDDGSHLDPITIFVTAATTLAAASLNSVALVAICSRREKMKPHQYLVVNLIVTDLLVAIVGAVMVAVSYESYHDKCMDAAERARARCAGSLLSRVWDVLLFANLFTLLLLTAEHFVACRWPFWHKIVLTRRKVALAVVACWVASCTPDAAAFAIEYDSAAASGRSLCAYLVEESAGAESWLFSAAVVAIMSAVLAALVGVYGYILYLIHRAGIGRIEAAKKRNAVVTTLLLLLSFVASYALFYAIHFSVALDQSAADSHLIVQLRRTLLAAAAGGGGGFPTSSLLLDYVVTGVLGAVLDPLIYCARTKEVKLFLLKLLNKKKMLRSRSGAAYVNSSTYGGGGAASSTALTGGGGGGGGGDYATVVTALAAEDEQL